MTELTCFVIMPFDTAFDGVYQLVREVIPSAIPNSNIRCVHLKDSYAAGRITDDIVEGITKASFCLADVSDANANVMWETGYAMAAGKPTILIRQPGRPVPFDLTSHRIHEYSTSQLDELRKLLPKAVRQTLAKYTVTSHPSLKPISKRRLTIAVTGSMELNRARAENRLEALIRPYLANNCLWLSGTDGAADETTIDFLLKNEQTVEAVGYNQYDLSHHVRELVVSNKLRFVDASVEFIPKGLDGPTARDEFFCAKADLVVLLWDAKSVGTSELIQYFRNRRINCLTAFV